MVMVADPTLIVYPFINHLALVCSEYGYVCVYKYPLCETRAVCVERELAYWVAVILTFDNWVVSPLCDRIVMWR